MAGELYRKPILFAIAATVVILIGTIVTMFYPMMREEMHPKMENLKSYTAIQLAGKDIYQREGCNNCHTQTVRPLRTEVMRYGEYSKAGEFAYDRPFLWGSKRTGPDLARIGGKYPDAWHYRHHENPQSMYPKSNMPKYAFLINVKIDASAIESHMKANGFPYKAEEIAALTDKTEMDALVAYLQVVGTSVKKREPRLVAEAGTRPHEKNPLAGDAKAIALGKKLYADNCQMCHGVNGKGDMGPSLVDDMFLYVKGDLADDDYFEIINNGTEAGMVEEGRTAKGGMPPYQGALDKNQIWSLVAYIRSLQGK
jgi:cytochrome c oxidase cbb3-type subunit 2